MPTPPNRLLYDIQRARGRSKNTTLILDGGIIDKHVAIELKSLLHRSLDGWNEGHGWAISVIRTGVDDDPVTAPLVKEAFQSPKIRFLSIDSVHDFAQWHKHMLSCIFEGYAFSPHLDTLHLTNLRISKSTAIQIRSYMRNSTSLQSLRLTNLACTDASATKMMSLIFESDADEEIEPRFIKILELFGCSRLEPEVRSIVGSLAGPNRWIRPLHLSIASCPTPLQLPTLASMDGLTKLSIYFSTAYSAGGARYVLRSGLLDSINSCKSLSRLHLGAINCNVVGFLFDWLEQQPTCNLDGRGTEDKGRIRHLSLRGYFDAASFQRIARYMRSHGCLERLEILGYVQFPESWLQEVADVLKSANTTLYFRARLPNDDAAQKIRIYSFRNWAGRRLLTTRLAIPVGLWALVLGRISTRSEKTGATPMHQTDATYHLLRHGAFLS